MEEALDESGEQSSVYQVVFILSYSLQSRVRECLVNLLNTTGQKVGLPKSPSVSKILMFLFDPNLVIEDVFKNIFVKLKICF